MSQVVGKSRLILSAQSISVPPAKIVTKLKVIEIWTGPLKTITASAFLPTWVQLVPGM